MGWDNKFTWMGFDGNNWSENSAKGIINIIADPVGIGSIIKTGSEDEDLYFHPSDLSNFILNSTSFVKAVSLPENGILLFDTQVPTQDHPFDGVPIYEGEEKHILVLVSGQLVFRPDPNFNGVASFLWRASKNDVWSDDELVKMNIIPIDDPPTVVNKLPDINLDEDHQQMEFDLRNIFTDVDNDDALISYELTGISNPDVLTSYIVNEILTLVFLANQHGSSELTITAISNQKTVQEGCHVTVNPVQDMPIAHHINILILENTSFSGQLTAFDADNDTLSYNMMKNGDKGTAIINSSNGSFTYTPTNYINGWDQFTFSVFDGIQDSNTATVSIYITPVNNAPGIAHIEKSGKENTPIFFEADDFSQVFTDPDNEPLSSIIIVNLPENGVVRLNNQPVSSNQTIGSSSISQLNFMPSADWAGQTEFSWKANDSEPLTSNQANVYMTIVSDPVHISMIAKHGDEDNDIEFTTDDISSFNLNGTSYLKIVSIPQDGSLLYDYVRPSQEHEFTPVQLSEGQEVHVSVFLSGILLYRPDHNFNGSDSFLWRASKNDQWTESDMVKLTIFPENDPPNAKNFTLAGIEDTDIVLNNQQFTDAFTDVDGDLLNSIKITALPSESLGILYIDNTPVMENTEIYSADISSIQFKAARNQFGSTQFSWQVFDGSSWSMNSRICTINIAPVPDTPVSQTIECPEDTQSPLIYLLKHPNDGDEVLYFNISQIQNGQLFIKDNDSPVENNSFISASNASKGLVFMPDENVTQDCGFDVYASENGTIISEQSEASHITIHIIPQDDPPKLVSPIDNIHGLEDEQISPINIANVFTDPDNNDANMNIQILFIDHPDLLQAELQNQTLHILLSDNQNGECIIRLCAESNHLTVTHDINVYIQAVDDPPYVKSHINTVFLNEDEGPESIDLSLVFKDIDSQHLTYQIIENSQPDLLTTLIDNQTLLINLMKDQHGTALITLMAMADNKHVFEQFFVQVAGVDDPPFVQETILPLRLHEDHTYPPLDISQTFFDIDNHDIKLSILANTKPSIINVQLSNQSLQLSLVTDQWGQAKITLLAESGGQSISHSFGIDILAVDDPPEVKQALADIELFEDAGPVSHDISQVFYDKDSDHEAITIQVIKNSNPLLVNAETIAHTLNLYLMENQHGKSMLVLEANSDGKSVTHTVKLNVEPVNDAPILTVVNKELNSITEDDISQTGHLISELIDSSIIDLDQNALSVWLL